MQRILWMVTVVVLGLSFGFEADAGCYKCDVNDCCAEAASNTSGLTVCSNSVICMGSYGCACYNCRRSGFACQGSGPADCPNPDGICEEHQSFLTVPNGSSAPQESWADPVVTDLGLFSATAGACAES